MATKKKKIKKATSSASKASKGSVTSTSKRKIKKTARPATASGSSSKLSASKKVKTQKPKLTIRAKSAAKKPAKPLPKKPISRSPAEKTKLKMEAIEKALRVAILGPKSKNGILPSADEINGAHDLHITESKFNIGVTHNAHAMVSHDIPSEYGKDCVKLLVVDPKLVFTYWEVRSDTLAEAKHKLGSHSKLTLRFYDITNTRQPELSPSWDVEVFDRLGNWYLRLEYPEQRLCLDVGLKNPSGDFIRIARSNIMRIPQNSLAKPGPIKWMVVTPSGEKLISDIEEYTDADLELLKKILGPYFYDLLMRGRFASISGSSLEAIFYNIETLRVGESPAGKPPWNPT